MSSRFFLFAIAGAIGFFVDVLSMMLLTSFMPLIWARAGAFWLAASSTWLVNRHLAFHQADKQHRLQQWVKSLMSAVIAFIPNWLTYILLVTWFESSVIIMPAWLETLWPYLALVPGILIGMFVNYFLSSRWVFCFQQA